MFPQRAMTEASTWVKDIVKDREAVLVAYPLCFDWTWLYWYFIQFSVDGSPFGYSRCFDIKTAISVKSAIPITEAGRKKISPKLRSTRTHTHHAIDDAIEQAEIFANTFQWEGVRGKCS